MTTPLRTRFACSIHCTRRVVDVARLLAAQKYWRSLSKSLQFVASKMGSILDRLAFFLRKEKTVETHVNPLLTLAFSVLRVEGASLLSSLLLWPLAHVLVLSLTGLPSLHMNAVNLCTAIFLHYSELRSVVLFAALPCTYGWCARAAAGPFSPTL